LPPSMFCYRDCGCACSSPCFVQPRTPEA
jgi:hypothetical protein